MMFENPYKVTEIFAEIKRDVIKICQILVGRYQVI